MYNWNELIEKEQKQEYFIKLQKFIDDEYKSKTIYPPKNMIYRALELTEFEKVKVVILGQDPYHKPNQAMGLAFSVASGNKIPPSLRNIYKEIGTAGSGDLTYLAKQGVLLINAVFTVCDSGASSHKNKGWEIFTDKIVTCLNNRENPVVFMLWGNYAKEKIKLITNTHHLILTAVHPSPLSASRGFFGCDHFNRTNEFLRKNGELEINWEEYKSY